MAKKKSRKKPTAQPLTPAVMAIIKAAARQSQPTPATLARRKAAARRWFPRDICTITAPGEAQALALQHLGVSEHEAYVIGRGLEVLQGEERCTVKAYVVFVNEKLPWQDETTVYVVRDAAPRYIIPHLGQALAAVALVPSDPATPLFSDWPAPGALPVLAATHFIAVSPLSVLPHSRVLTAPEPLRVPWDPTKPNSRAATMIDLHPCPLLRGIYREDQRTDRIAVDYLYAVYCDQKADKDDQDDLHWKPQWEVEVHCQLPPANPCAEVLQDGTRMDRVYQIVYTRQPLPDLLKHIKRLDNLVELGGQPENY